MAEPELRIEQHYYRTSHRQMYANIFIVFRLISNYNEHGNQFVYIYSIINILTISNNKTILFYFTQYKQKKKGKVEENPGTTI